MQNLPVLPGTAGPNLRETKIWRLDMPNQLSGPAQHKAQAGSPYCSDPNCEYCKELRRMFEQIRKDNHSSSAPQRSADSWKQAP